MPGGKEQAKAKAGVQAFVEARGGVNDKIIAANISQIPETEDAELNPAIAKLMEPIDAGFYGHMDVKKAKSIFKSPTILDGQNGSGRK